MRQWTHEGEAFHNRGNRRHPHSQGAMRTCGSHIPVVLTGDYGTLPVSVSHSEPNKERGQKIISIFQSKTQDGK